MVRQGFAFAEAVSNPRSLLRIAATFAGSYSGDTRTQNGAVLADAAGRVVACGVNRLPACLKTTADRLAAPAKYDYVEHAERAAIYAAAAAGVRTAGCTLYCLWFACPDCARAIAMAGIEAVVGLASIRRLMPARWEERVTLGERILAECGVDMRWIGGDVGQRIMFDGQEVLV